MINFERLNNLKFKKLWELRQKIIADPDVKLLDWKGIEAELDKIRGRSE